MAIKTHRLHIRLCLLLIALLALASCGKDDKPEPKYTHTVMIYFPWSGYANNNSSLIGMFRENMTSIENAIISDNGTGNIRVLMLMASSTTEGDLYEIVYSNGVCTQKPLKKYTNWSFTSTENIITMLNDVASYSPTPGYSMLMGGHGLGWLPKEINPIKKKAFGGLEAATRTDIDQLATAIQQSQMKRLTYLCFDDCYMANIETAYELRNATDYIIASTSEIMNIGLPYERIWTQLKRNVPDFKTVISEFHSFYTTYTYPYGALSAIDCAQLDQAAQLMRQLNTRLAEAGIAPSDITSQRLDAYNRTIFFDMEDYTKQAIAALGGDKELQMKFTQLYSDMIIAHSCTPKIYSNGLALEVAANCGLTISDPTTNQKVAQAQETTGWYKATRP